MLLSGNVMNYKSAAAIKMAIYIYIIAGTLGSCQSEKTYNYPRRQEQQIQLLCNVIYEKEYGQDKNWKDASPQIITVHPNHITVYFSNGLSESIPKDEKIILEPGPYRCE